MCAAEASYLLSSLKLNVPRGIVLSPTAILKTKIDHLFQKQQNSIKHSSELQAKFKLIWGIDEQDERSIIARTHNSLVVRVRKKEIPEEEKGAKWQGPNYVAKIFCATYFLNEEGHLLCRDEDIHGIKELTHLKLLAEYEVPHIPAVQAASWDFENKKTILVFQDLGTHLDAKFLTIPMIKRMSIHILQCLTEMSKIAPNLKHGDIKLLNVMEDGILIDWHGMSEGRNCDLENCMTLFIRAPEVILRLGKDENRLGDYGPEVDIWSLGITVFEGASGKRFSDIEKNHEELEQLHSIYNRTGKKIPIEMQQLSPVRQHFFDKRGKLKRAPDDYPIRSHYSQSLTNVSRTITINLPKEDPNRIAIETYYGRLIELLDYVLILDPKVRPHSGKVLQKFYDLGLN